MPTLENCTSGRWHPAFTDITARGADKGKGLQAMADYLGLNIEETMAFGDGGNEVVETFTPQLNSLSLFSVPQLHQVSLVAPWAGSARYSITGWFRRD